MRLPGSFTRSRVKFCASPMMRPCSSAAVQRFFAVAPEVTIDKLVDLLVLPIALVIIGIEVADVSAFDDRFNSVRHATTMEDWCVTGAAECASPVQECGATKAKLFRSFAFSVRTAAPASLRSS